MLVGRLRCWERQVCASETCTSLRCGAGSLGRPGSGKWSVVCGFALGTGSSIEISQRDFLGAGVPSLGSKDLAPAKGQRYKQRKKATHIHRQPSWVRSC